MSKENPIAGDVFLFAGRIQYKIDSIRSDTESLKEWLALAYDSTPVGKPWAALIEIEDGTHRWQETDIISSPISDYSFLRNELPPQPKLLKPFPRRINLIEI